MSMWGKSDASSVGFEPTRRDSVYGAPYRRGSSLGFASSLTSRSELDDGLDALLPEELSGSDLNFLIQQAVIYLEEGQNNLKFDTHPNTPDKIRKYNRAHTTFLRLLHLLTSLALCALAIIEKPTPHGPRSSLTPGAYIAIEISCVLTLAGCVAVVCNWLGWRGIARQPAIVTQIILLLAIFIECLVTVGKGAHDENNNYGSLRITRMFRPFFVAMNYYATGVRRVLRQILQCMLPTASVLGLLLLFMFVFSLIGFYCFGGNSADPNFKDFHTSFVSMFVLITTANYPDVMMPAFNNSPYAFFFFLLYLGFGLFFLMNLVLAVVYDAFRGREEQKCKRLYLHRRAALRYVHKLLSDETKGGIPFSKFRAMMAKRSPRRSPLSIRLFFMSLDESETDSLGLREFYNFYEAEKFSFKKKKSKQATPGPAPRGITAILAWVSRRCNKIVTHQVFRIVSNLVILAISVIIVYDAWHYDNAKSDHAQINLGHEVWFVVLSWIEAALKVTGLGFFKYWSEGWNRLALLLTTLCTVVYLLDRFATTNREEFVVVLRQLIILRLFEINNQFKEILEIAFELLPQLLSFVVALALVFYTFAIIGMEQFGGTVHKGCCGSSYYGGYDANSTSTAADLYYLNNFDTIFSSYVTLFELMVVNNWFVIMDGFVSVTSEWNRLYFMVFYLVTVVIVLNVVIAFILETFLSRMQAKRTSEANIVDTFVNRTVYMRAPMYYNYVRENLSSIELQSLEMQWVQFSAHRERGRFDYQLITFNDAVASWLMEEEQNLRSDTLMMQRSSLPTEFHRNAAGQLRAGPPQEFIPRVRADSTVTRPPLAEIGKDDDEEESRVNQIIKSLTKLDRSSLARVGIALKQVTTSRERQDMKGREESGTEYS
eukprot:m.70170 g.70170  ORF g.70170 m.70170 type:complete len:884 (+) comp12111_c0_seq2:340-2991(+)